MVHPFSRTLAALANPPIVDSHTRNTSSDDPRMVALWYVEAALARIRWFAVLACSLVIPLHRSVPWPFLMFIAIGLAAGNCALIRLILRGTDNANAARRLGTGLDWGGTLALIAAVTRDSEPTTPAILLVLLGTTAARYGRRGLVVSGTAVIVVAVALGAAHAYIFRDASPSATQLHLARWALTISVAALVLGGLLQAGEDWHRWLLRQRRAPRDAASAQDFALTPREQEVLRFLAVQPKLTYPQIGTQLYISGETVKSHVESIAAKLGVSGRAAVVAVARERGLLPPVDADG